MRHPQRGRGIALRVHVDDQHLSAMLGQCRRDIHRGGRLAHTALLIRDRDTTGTLRFRERGIVQGTVPAACIRDFSDGVSG